MVNIVYTQSAIFQLGSLTISVQATVAVDPPVVNWLILFHHYKKFGNWQLEPVGHNGRALALSTYFMLDLFLSSFLAL